MKINYPRIKWTDAENQILRKHYTRRNSGKVLHETLLPNRTTSAIIHQANILKLVTRYGAYHEYTLDELLGDTIEVMKRPDLGMCMEWTGDKRPNGYGVVTHNNKRWPTHRLVLALMNIEIGDNLALHHCDHRLCIRPTHLYVGTYTDNNRDTVRRGRYRNQYGPHHESR